MSRRVVITGIGLVTPLGLDRHETWRNLLLKKSAAAPIQQFVAESWPVNFACEVPAFELTPGACLDHQQRLLNRPNLFAMQAAWEAMADAKLSDTNTGQRHRFGVAVGTGIGVIKPQHIFDTIPDGELASAHVALAASLEKHNYDGTLGFLHHPGTLAQLMAERWRAHAFATTHTTACAASAHAILNGVRAIRDGSVDVVLAGGADSLSGELLFAGFTMLGVLSKGTREPTRCSRPFDRNRDGFVAGEGAAMLVLEEREQALRAGKFIYAEIGGVGESENAYRITDLPEDAHGVISSMRQALIDAACYPHDIDLVNAHGTATEQNDRVEALGIARVFYDHGARPAITANKSQIGHLVAAAGAVECAISALSIVNQEVPPILNLEDPIRVDPHELDFVARSPRHCPIRKVISNSIGFGGSNVSVILERNDG